MHRNDGGGSKVGFGPLIIARWLLFERDLDFSREIEERGRFFIIINLMEFLI